MLRFAPSAWDYSYAISTMRGDSTGAGYGAGYTAFTLPRNITAAILFVTVQFDNANFTSGAAAPSSSAGPWLAAGTPPLQHESRRSEEYSRNHASLSPLLQDSRGHHQQKRYQGRQQRHAPSSPRPPVLRDDDDHPGGGPTGPVATGCGGAGLIPCGYYRFLIAAGSEPYFLGMGVPLPAARSPGAALVVTTDTASAVGFVAITVSRISFYVVNCPERYA